MSALSALPPPLITIRNESFFWVDGGWRCWLCLTDAQRYYTTLQFWQVTGSQMGCIQDSWRASRPILSATRGAGETPALPRGYAIISDAPVVGSQCVSSSRVRRAGPLSPGLEPGNAARAFKVADLIVLVELTAETRRGTKRKSYLSRCERSSHLADPNRLGHPGADRTDARPHSTGRAGQSGPLIRGLSYCPRSCGRPRPLVGIQT